MTDRANGNPCCRVDDQGSRTADRQDKFEFGLAIKRVQGADAAPIASARK
jgi:hypothetical protein